uniref:Family with sequence similarity 120B n=1 Tax=Neogobius melanostomus TaxID=47308 RepID=A0A8C6UWB6_9GOBI
MGVKGLQNFMDSCCPEACVTVNLREMAKQHAVPQRAPTLVVDGMACLRQWYSCKDWVSGGQWKEYMDILKSWVEVFNLAGIRLVFFFDGVVEELKRQSWLKRRRRVNGDVCKIFSYIKSCGEQPTGEMCVLPSGLATFTRFALKSLGQEVFCSVREADFEISSYAREHNCMGILGQDTDFIIYDSAPYLSSSKLRMDTLTTVLYDRQRLCQALGLAVYQLPLLACVLGNDVVSEERIFFLSSYRQSNSTPHPGAQRGQMIFALLERGIQSYFLSDQRKHQSTEIIDHPAAVYQKYVSSTILQACREKHAAAEGFMVYSVVSEGVVECSNSLEDEEDTELLPQALVFKPCRQRIYGLLLLQNGTDINPPAIKEWFVYPGNPLKEPEMVPPVPLNLHGNHPALDLLWFGKGPEVSSMQLSCFLAILDCQDLSDLYGTIEEPIFITVCLVTHIVIQVQTLSQEDVDAYLSQALCLAQKSSLELQEIKLPFLCSRVVQLGCLYVRGLSYLLGANCASGCPLTTDALMPWNSFDGRLFHSKYLLAHSGVEDVMLLDNDVSSLTVLHHLRAKVKEVCLKKGRILQSRPRHHTPQFSLKTREEPRHRGDTQVRLSSLEKSRLTGRYASKQEAE